MILFTLHKPKICGYTKWFPVPTCVCVNMCIYRNACAYIYVYINIYRERESERERVKKMQGWTTSVVKKIKNLMKTFRSETFFSYLQLLNKKEL